MDFASTFLTSLRLSIPSRENDLPQTLTHCKENDVEEIMKRAVLIDYLNFWGPNSIFLRPLCREAVKCIFGSLCLLIESFHLKVNNNSVVGGDFYMWA